MSIFLSFLKLPSWEKKVALESLLWVIRIRIMLWIFPFTTVQTKVQERVIKHHSTSEHVITMPRLRIMIVAASRYVPRATCLVQALAGYILFSKYGYSTSIKIGVLTENGEFEAHAWLEHDEKVVLGESEKNFTTILGID
jgi:heme/copper-type cytochrome/quinol oxidase subunit 2